MNVIIYSRQSVDDYRYSHDKRHASLSIQSQYSACREYAAKMGWNLVSQLAHNNWSGGDNGRFFLINAGVTDAISKAHLPGSQYVILAYNLDRFGRDAGALLQWVRMTNKIGIHVWTVRGGEVMLKTSDGLLHTGIEALLAEHQRMQAQEKTKLALARLREMGQRYSGRAPYGYRFEVTAEVVPDADEQHVLTQMRKWLDEGRGWRETARLLTACGLFNREGGPFHHQTIRRIVMREQAEHAKV